MLEVLDPGLLTTIQDLGRPGWGHLGVPAGGAADPWSVRVANLVAGNVPGAAALEITLAGPRLRAIAPVTVAIGGADLGADLAPGRPRHLARGEELAVPGPASKGGGARAYLAIAGGIDVPVVLGSRSTCLAGGFGGLDGRPIRAGDRLAAGDGAAGPPTGQWPAESRAPRVTDPDGTTVLRVLAGLHGGAPPGGTFRVSPSSNRMGLRLEPATARSPGPAETVVSHGVPPGAVQVPPDGQPIVLLADHQPTGGYPVVAVVIAADLAAAGQLAPGDVVRFEPVDRPTARRALADLRRRWQEAVDLIGSDARWEELSRSAGA